MENYGDDLLEKWCYGVLQRQKEELYALVHAIHVESP
jgi:hypothetical protein